MLKTKKELVTYLHRLCVGLSFNSDLLNQVITEIKQENNVPTGVMTDIIAGRTNMEEDSVFLLFLLLHKLDEINHKKHTEDFFTENEISFYLTQQFDTGEIRFPIEIKCIQVAPDQWIGVVDVNLLMDFRKAQLINYNANAQRTMQRVVHGDKEIYKITLNTKAVKEIKNSLQSGAFIPNTITLNMPQDTDWSYDAKKNILTINKISAFDISDGYHRYVSMFQIKESDPEFNYPVELRIINFPDDKIKQFIYQEDQKTKMRKIDSASMNMSSPANIVLERLNTDAMFDLKGNIQRSGGQINFGYAGNILEFLKFKGIKSAPMSEIVQIKDILKTEINNFVETYPDYFEKRFSFEEILILFYGVLNDWSVKTIKEKIDKIDLLDKRIFKNRITKKSMINAIEKL